MDEKCTECGLPLMSWRCKCSVNPYVRAEDAQAANEAQRLLASQQPFATTQQDTPHGK